MTPSSSKIRSAISDQQNRKIDTIVDTIVDTRVDTRVDAIVDTFVDTKVESKSIIPYFKNRTKETLKSKVPVGTEQREREEKEIDLSIDSNSRAPMKYR